MSNEDMNADMIYAKLDCLHIGNTENFGSKRVYRKDINTWVYKDKEYTDIYTLADIIF